jgi:hypothetical protein
MVAHTLPTRQFEETERLLEHAKAEEDWANMSPAEADAITKHPAVRAIIEAFPGATVTAIRTLK